VDNFLFPSEQAFGGSMSPGFITYSRRSGGPHVDVLRVQIGRPPAPFIWQSEQRLLLLDEEHAVWVFAELEFDPATCRYVEIRRAAYEMEREAVGALLSRALASGMKAVEDSAASLNAWLIRFYGHSIQESRARPRTRAY